ncbi:MAG TPA: hypothetical protein ENJ35_04325 [Gammaproteobacteria bacterium]|nr:hypothetical protein [Gammaproteobacteria bacterium]
MSHRQLPYDSDHLTPVENDVNQQQEKRNCTTCDHLVRDRRGGARKCEESEEMTSVLAGERICDEYVPIREES